MTTLKFSFRKVTREEFQKVAGGAYDEQKSYSIGFSRLRANFFDETGELIGLMIAVENEPTDYYIQDKQDA